MKTQTLRPDVSLPTIYLYRKPVDFRKGQLFDVRFFWVKPSRVIKTGNDPYDAMRPKHSPFSPEGSNFMDVINTNLAKQK